MCAWVCPWGEPKPSGVFGLRQSERSESGNGELWCVSKLILDAFIHSFSHLKTLIDDILHASSSFLVLGALILTLSDLGM